MRILRCSLCSVSRLARRDYSSQCHGCRYSMRSGPFPEIWTWGVRLGRVIALQLIYSKSARVSQKGKQSAHALTATLSGDGPSHSGCTIRSNHVPLLTYAINVHPLPVPFPDPCLQPAYRTSLQCNPISVRDNEERGMNRKSDSKGYTKSTNPTRLASISLYMTERFVYLQKESFQ